jgi:hypothetical protein
LPVWKIRSYLRAALIAEYRGPKLTYNLEAPTP